MLEAPFTTEQVKSLNEYQESGVFHPFTCGTDKCRCVLIAAEDGWTCPECDYTQNWAHEWMGDNSWKQSEIFKKTGKEK
jgi:hypothetical protein